MAFSDPGERQEPIVEFARWTETPTERRESGSKMDVTSVWDSADPSLALATETDNPTRVFLVNPSIAAGTDAGARQGPFGSILKNEKIAQRSQTENDEPLPASPRRTETRFRQTARIKIRTARAREKPSVPAPMPLCGPILPSRASPDDPMELPPMPPMTAAHPVADSPPEGSEQVPNRRRRRPRSRAARTMPVGPLAKRPRRRARVAIESLCTGDEEIIRTSDQFIAMLHRLGSRGWCSPDRPGAVLDLPATVIEGTGRVQVHGRAG